MRDTFVDLCKTLREPPADILLELGDDGEILLARIRLLFASLLMVLPAINYYVGGERYESLIGLAGVGIAVLLSQVWLTLARRRRRYSWLPFLSAIFDVSTISMVLLLLAYRNPADGLNSLVVFSFYPLAVLTTALRNDARVTLLCGLLAVLELLAISAYFLANANGSITSDDHGTVTASNQMVRALLLLASTLMTTFIVYRMQRLVKLSGTDTLTGLPNRSFLNLRVPKIVADARASGETLSLALIDLDRFKQINDELGHPAGDRALRHVVETLRLELHRDEPLIRVGGEEFVLILHRPIGAAWERMDALRRKLEACQFVPGEGLAPRILTFSAGMAASPGDADNVSGLMRTADLRLREAKLAGRNRIVARDSR